MPCMYEWRNAFESSLEVYLLSLFALKTRCEVHIKLEESLKCWCKFLVVPNPQLWLNLIFEKTRCGSSWRVVCVLGGRLFIQFNSQSIKEIKICRNEDDLLKSIAFAY